jgi:hypothetical protein
MLEYWYQYRPYALKRALHITPNKLLEGDRILNKHLRANRGRETPFLGAFFFDGWIGTGDCLRSTADDFGNTPLLSLRHSPDLSIELVRKLYLGTNHEMILQRLKNDVK